MGAMCAPTPSGPSENEIEAATTIQKTFKMAKANKEVASLKAE
jgi:hypothetical protein